VTTKEDLDALTEIVDALAAKLARDRPFDETLKLIAARARSLYRRRVDNEEEINEGR
jgi:hypothetical protein